MVQSGKRKVSLPLLLGPANYRPQSQFSLLSMTVKRVWLEQTMSIHVCVTSSVNNRVQ